MLRIWLPLDGDLHNQGCSPFTISSIEAAPIFTAGKIGQCYQRTNSNSQLTNGLRIENNLIDLFGSTASIAVWVKPLGTHTHYNGTILSSGNWNAQKWAFGVSQDNSKVDILCGGQNNYITCAVPVNEWTHLVSTFDNGTCKLYKNGVYVGQLTGQAAFVSDATWTGVGRESYANGYFGFNGCINDLRIYDHCLSAAEVKEIAQGLVLHYKLDGGLFGNPNLYTGSEKFTGTWNNMGNWATSSETYQNFVVKQRSGAWGGLSQNIPCTQGDIFTISFYGKVDSGGTIMSIHRSSLGNVTTGLTILKGNFINGTTWIRTTDDGTQWKRYWATIQITSSDITYLQWRLENNVANKNFYVCGIKLEKSNVATPWCPADSEMNIDRTIIEDSSGYNHNGQMISNINISNDTMRYNTSALFDGVDDCIIVPYNTICPENIFTINLWFKKDALGSKNYETLFGGPSGFEMDTRAGSSTALSLYMASTRGGNAATGLQLNTWYMVTMVRDGTNERYYINGELKKEIEAKAMPTGIYRIGAWNSNTGQNYYGNISDFRIYCTPLLDTDIKQLYNVGMKVDNKQNIHIFELNENNVNIFSSTPWTDAYGNHNPSSNPFKNYNNLNEPQFTANMTSAGSDFITITPGTYEYDYTISINAGNQFYIGFERYDADKTSRSNSACVYTLNTKPSTDIVKQRYKGTVDLSTDGVNPIKYITLRILSGWSGTTSGVTGQATIHNFSLKLQSTAINSSITKQGQLIVGEYKEDSKASIYKDHIVEAHQIIER